MRWPTSIYPWRSLLAWLWGSIVLLVCLQSPRHHPCRVEVCGHDARNEDSNRVLQICLHDYKTLARAEPKGHGPSVFGKPPTHQWLGKSEREADVEVCRDVLHRHSWIALPARFMFPEVCAVASESRRSHRLATQAGWHHEVLVPLACWQDLAGRHTVSKGGDCGEHVLWRVGLASMVQVEFTNRHGQGEGGGPCRPGENALQTAGYGTEQQSHAHQGPRCCALRAGHARRACFPTRLVLVHVEKCSTRRGFLRERYVFSDGMHAPLNSLAAASWLLPCCNWSQFLWGLLAHDLDDCWPLATDSDWFLGQQLVHLHCSQRHVAQKKPPAQLRSYVDLRAEVSRTLPGRGGLPACS
mmetsp:Transcript_18997/g.44330  ORF Transcript_18997/g.44330 Transcript_18997/m.44330 type:complete len:355 (-) Transcript_18997:729-1793(-)